MEELQGAAEAIWQMALRREVLSLCWLVSFPTCGLAQQSYLGFSWDRSTPSWDGAGELGTFLWAALAAGAAQLHRVVNYDTYEAV